MAQGRRVERVAALIRKEVSELMINGIRDERVHQGMVSITEVEVSGDLQHCKVFSEHLWQRERTRPATMCSSLRLQAASPYLRGELSRRLEHAPHPRSWCSTTIKGLEPKAPGSAGAC